MYNIRTDLAIESREALTKNCEDIPGIRLSEQHLEDEGIVSTVYIDTENASKYLSRPKGVYVTLETDRILSEEVDECVVIEIAKIIRRVLHLSGDIHQPLQKNVLIVGLGNREVTPDSLGPGVVDQLIITRHLLNEYGGQISGIAPGVMGQTGMECREIIRGIVRQIKPDYVVTVDALAARDAERLSRTIQFTDTGITPGSGVGNHRKAINKESIGVPVLSIGIPTVIDTATIIWEVVSRNEGSEHIHIDPKWRDMFVTPKNIDENIRRLSYLLSKGINVAFLGE